MSTIRFYQGDHVDLGLEIKEDGEPTSIEGWKVYFTAKVKATDDDEDAVLKKDVLNHQNPQEGETIIKFISDETDKVEPGNYVYDIQIKDDQDKIQTVISGSLIVNAQITRRKNNE